MTNHMTRRAAMGRLAGAGLGFATIAKAQSQVPTWKTEMRELAPGVFAYIQGGGPGQMNQGVSNGGAIVGENSVLVIDSLGAPIQTKNFILGMDVQTIVPGHGPLGGKKDLAEMSEYIAVFKAEARKRYDAGMSAGRPQRISSSAGSTRGSERMTGW